MGSVGWTPRVETRATGDAGELIVNGQVVLRLRRWQGTQSPDQRTTIAAERLRAALAATAGQMPEVIADTTTDKANPRLKFAGQVIVTASKEEAKEASSSPAALAQSWASALRRALAIPGLIISDTGLILPLNETRTLRLGGAARGDVVIATASGAPIALVPAPASTPAAPGGPSMSPSSSDSPTTLRPVVTASVNPETGELTLSGLTPGREVLTLTREGATATVTVAVQPYAGRFDAPRQVTLTGTTVSPNLVARLASASALGSALPNPGAAARIAADSLSVSVPPPGETRSILIPVGLTGTDMIPVTRTIRVPVVNTSLPTVSTSSLFYSNDPERLTQYGTLFTGRLTTEKSATRLLFHHQSDFSQPIWFTVELLNDSATPAQVQVVGGSSGPVRDTVWVGYRAASSFMRDFFDDAGAVVTVPARSRVALLATRLAPGLTVSGIMQLRVVGGAQSSATAPLVRVAAEVPGGPNSVPEEWLPFPLTIAASNANAGLSLSDHVYPNPTKKLTATYSVGGPWAFLSVGREAIPGSNAELKLLGNYGVLYEMDLKLENPTAAPARARVIFEPSAGLAGGVFFVDGKPVEIPQTNLPNEPELAVYTLQPGEKRSVKVQTVPLSGSNYPVRVVVRP